jgi:hypothetical protein
MSKVSNERKSRAIFFFILYDCMQSWFNLHKNALIINLAYFHVLCL